MDFNYISPITKIEQEISGQIIETEEGTLMYEVKKAIGYEIDKEELIKALQYERQQYERGYKDGFYANKWIPCSRELPKDTFPVLVDVNVRTVMNVRVTRTAWFNTVKKIWIVHREDNEVIGEVVAWQSLPEPYKESEEE